MGKKQKLICELLEIIEQEPYCKSSDISIEGIDSNSLLNQLNIIRKEHLIAADRPKDGSGDHVYLINIHLTLRGLIYLRKHSSIELN